MSILLKTSTNERRTCATKMNAESGDDNATATHTSCISAQTKVDASNGELV